MPAMTWASIGTREKPNLKTGKCLVQPRGLTNPGTADACLIRKKPRKKRVRGDGLKLTSCDGVRKGGVESGLPRAKVGVGRGLEMG